MASKRQLRIALLVLMAFVLVFPPLTSAVADGLGIELAHHHCDSHWEHSLDTDLEQEAFHEQEAIHEHDHGAAEADPFQCDQCHVVLAALAVDEALVFRDDRAAPIAVPALRPVPVQSPPQFKPPIA